jgi:uncharacterized protein
MVNRIIHNTGQNRYELFVDDELASVAEYRTEDGRVVFEHSETGVAFRGRGLAAELVGWALDDVRARGLKVVPQCSFVADFIEHHPEYQDLLSAA